jgi:hypothetical protein
LKSLKTDDCDNKGGIHARFKGDEDTEASTEAASAKLYYVD